MSKESTAVTKFSPSPSAPSTNPTPNPRPPRRRGTALALSAAITGALALSGCMVGPNYKQPGSPVPDRYSAAYPTTQPLSTQPAVTQPTATTRPVTTDAPVVG